MMRAHAFTLFILYCEADCSAGKGLIDMHGAKFFAKGGEADHVVLNE